MVSPESKHIHDWTLRYSSPVAVKYFAVHAYSLDAELLKENEDVSKYKSTFSGLETVRSSETLVIN